MNIHVNQTSLVQAERQASLEVEMQGRGAARYRNAADKALDKGRAAGTAPGTFLIKRVVDPLREGISKFLEDANSGRRGPRMASARVLDGLDTGIVAYLTAKVVISTAVSRRSSTSEISGTAPLTKVARAIGNALEDEARFSHFDEESPELFAKVMRSSSGRGTSEVHQRKVLMYAMGKYDIAWDRWSDNDKIITGTKLIEILAETTGMIEIERMVSDTDARGGGGKRVKQTPYVISLTDKVTEWFSQHLARGELLRPLMMPTVIQPAPWQGVHGGGYHTDVVRPQPLVKAPVAQQQALLEEADLGVTLRGLNAVQNTPWEVNREVLEVMRQAVKVEAQIDGIVPADPQFPERPSDADTNEEAEKAWKFAMRDTHKAIVALRGDRLRQGSRMEIAERFKEEGDIFFPHNLDFRGRAYPLPQTVNPQGPDETKGLLRFAKGIALGTENAADWLAIHGANTFGNDKVDLEERVEWVEQHEREILASAEDPLGYFWWTEADSPWCFLAFCFEWAGYKREGLRFKSKLPVAQDGSCNGLQHFSAMLRDPIGGEAVNLTPSDRPQDIYQRVADRVIERMREILKQNAGVVFEPEIEPKEGEGKDDKKSGLSPAQIDRFCRGWLNVGLDRDITKRPVMVLPYGGTPRSCRKYVKEKVYKRFTDGLENPFGDETYLATGWLSTMIWESIGDVVVAAKTAMAWLQKVARVVAKANLPIHWTTPSGFVAFQRYVDLEKRTIKTKLQGSVVQLIRAEETDDIDVNKQALAMAPNFVHSMDASAMFLTIDRALDDGITDFAMIHDSYGTHAANTEALSQHIRQAFVSMYEGNVLEGIREQILAQIPADLHDDLPPAPALGTLDVNSVLESDFFFA